MKADLAERPSCVVADSCTSKLSLNKLVGAQDEAGGKVYPESIRGLKVYDQVELGRLLDRQIGKWFRAERRQGGVVRLR